MSLQEVYWAMTHDWYYYTGTVNGHHVVHVHDTITGRTLAFDSYYKLRIWAGY